MFVLCFIIFKMYVHVYQGLFCISKLSTCMRQKELFQHFFLQQGALFTNLTRLSYLFYKQLYPHPRKKPLGAGWGWGGGLVSPYFL